MAMKGILLYNIELRRCTEGYITRPLTLRISRETVDCNQSVLGAEAALSPFCLLKFFVLYSVSVKLLSLSLISAIYIQKQIKI